MYGLTSRESLSKRQSCWARSDEKQSFVDPVKSRYPVQSHTEITKEILDPCLIDIMTDYDFENQSTQDHNNLYCSKITESSTLQGQPSYFNNRKIVSDNLMGFISDKNEDELLEQNLIKKKNFKLESEGMVSGCDSTEKTKLIRKSEQKLGLDLTNKIQKLELDLTGKIQNLELGLSNKIHNLELSQTNPQILENITLLINRVSNLEKLLNHHNNLVVDKSLENSLDLVKEIESNNKIKEFVPYIINENYASRDNFSKLNGMRLEMTVEILGFYLGELIIYPFGTEKYLPNFAEMMLEMKFKDADKLVDGTAHGLLQKQTDGIYTIKFIKLYSGDVISNIEQYTLPITFTCSTKLKLE